MGSTDAHHAFTRAYEQHYWPVFRYCLRRGATQEESADVCAEVFLVAWRRWDDAPSALAPWLFGVARKTLANHVRGSQRQQALHQALAHDTMTTQPNSSAAASPVLAALLTLPDSDQEILLLHTWEELRLHELAAALGCSYAAAAVRLSRAKTRLRRALLSAAGSSPRTTLPQGEPS